jgi:hypothetical protein
VADDARFRLDILHGIDFSYLTRELDAPLFVEYSDVLNFLLASDVVNDLVDVVPGVEHHGIVGTQPDGIPQSVCLFDHMVDGVRLMVLDIDICPTGNASKEYQANPEDELKGKALPH